MSSERTWRFLDHGAAGAAENMAVDGELLQSAADRGDAMPVLRFYSWDPPAVSLGRFQDEEDSVDREACRRLGIGIVRRVTGGRAVLHYRELTYSITARGGGGLFPDDILGTYRLIAAGLLAGLRNLGLEAEMCSRPVREAGRKGTKRRDPACFSSPSLYELLVRGRKIVGSAQRRIAGAFLQHGSILIEHDHALEAAVIRGGGTAGTVTSIRRELGRQVSLDEVKDAMKRGFSEALGLSFRT